MNKSRKDNLPAPVAATVAGYEMILGGVVQLLEQARRASARAVNGVILCTEKDLAVVHYALENLPNKVLAAEYRTTLPDEKALAAELEAKRRLLEARGKARKGGQP